MHPKLKLVLRGTIGGMFQTVIFSALLFIPAGTLKWNRAIGFIIVYFILSQISIISLGILAPASLEARLQKPSSKSQPFADRILTMGLIIMFLAWFAFIPLDVFHFHLLPTPHWIISGSGTVLFFGGYFIIWVTLFQNAFAAPIVKDQSDRKQVLVDTGLYRLIRHPFYLGTILFLVGIALWLESLACLILLPIFFILLYGRIDIEEKTLKNMLPGYRDYIKQVPYRLIPYVW